MSSVDGVLLLHKPTGITSFEALQTVKNHFHTRKVGHAGTLDRFARGLLLVVVGAYTRLVDLIQELEKEYVGIIEFGRETDTLDPEGEVIAEGPVPRLEQIEQQISSFLGTILQSPPTYSAVHVKGERAYRMARKGVWVDPPPRPVEIRSLRIEEYDPPYLTVRVVCGKGTYIRSIARDLGRRCNSAAYLRELTRVRIGDFLLEDAVLPTDLEKASPLYEGAGFLSRLFPDRVLQVSPDMGVSEGRPLRPALWKDLDFQEGPYILVYPEGELAGAVQYKEGRLSYRFVVPRKSL
ncbi:MAG: hypothetical protein Kow009_09380 [Spirochaetales bacterium]